MKWYLPTCRWEHGTAETKSASVSAGYQNFIICIGNKRANGFMVTFLLQFGSTTKCESSPHVLQMWFAKEIRFHIWYYPGSITYTLQGQTVHKQCFQIERNEWKGLEIENEN